MKVKIWTRLQEREPQTIINVTFLFITMSFSTYLLEVPTVILFEKVICDSYYRQHPISNGVIDESLCKLSPIQTRLADIMGLKSSFDAIPGKFLIYLWRYLFLG